MLLVWWYSRVSLLDESVFRLPMISSNHQAKMLSGMQPVGSEPMGVTTSVKNILKKIKTFKCLLNHSTFGSTDFFFNVLTF